MIKIALVVLVLINILFAFSLCRMAALTDAQMEKDFQAWMAQRKDKEDTNLADF